MDSMPACVAWMTCDEGEEVLVFVFCDCCCNNRRPGPSRKGVVDAAEGRMFEGTWSPGRTMEVVLILAESNIDCVRNR